MMMYYNLNINKNFSVVVENNKVKRKILTHDRRGGIFGLNDITIVI